MQEATRVRLNFICDQIQDLVRFVRDDTIAAVNTNDHVALIRHYAELDAGIDKIKEARKALDEIDEKLSREQVPDAMRVAGVKTTTVEGVGRVTIGFRWSCSLLDKPLGFEWLRKNGHGGLIQPTIAAQSLAAWAKHEVETSGKDLPDDVFKVGQMAYTSLTRK